MCISHNSSKQQTREHNNSTLEFNTEDVVALYLDHVMVLDDEVSSTPT